VNTYNTALACPPISAEPTATTVWPETAALPTGQVAPDVGSGAARATGADTWTSATAA
jgi:hypothetical protein